jgi:hypothetical protein
LELVIFTVCWYPFLNLPLEKGFYTNMYQLTETPVKKAKPEPQPQKLFDGRGLYLHIAPTGSKLWRYAYRFDGKQKLMALGAYPDVSVAQARDRHAQARKVLAGVVDPMEQRKAVKEAQDAKQTTFEDVFDLWFEKWAVGKDDRHAEQTKRRMNQDCEAGCFAASINLQ